MVLAKFNESFKRSTYSTYIYFHIFIFAAAAALPSYSYLYSTTELSCWVWDLGDLWDL